MEISEAGIHIRYLMAYMGDSFLSRGGDYDAIQVRKYRVVPDTHFAGYPANNLA